MIEYFLIVVGIFLLIKGAGWLVDGATALASKLGVSQIVIGLTVVAFGTSMPELVVNIVSSLNGSGEIALGNIIGSNLANILLVLGILAFLKPVQIKIATVTRQIPFEILSALVLLLLAGQLTHEAIPMLSRADGVILILFFVVFLYYIGGANKIKDVKQAGLLHIKKLDTKSAIILVCGGMISIYFGGQWTVDSTIAIAKGFGMSEFLISATVVAIGTSLPELVTTIVAVKRTTLDLAVGNLIGSNIFNIFWVLGLSAVIRPIEVPAYAGIDISFLILASLAMFFCLFTGKRHELKRGHGIFLIAFYLFLITLLVIRG